MARTPRRIGFGASCLLVRHILVGGGNIDVLDMASINDAIGPASNGVGAYSSAGRPATATFKLEVVSDRFIKNRGAYVELHSGVKMIDGTLDGFVCLLVVLARLFVVF